MVSSDSAFVRATHNVDVFIMSKTISKRLQLTGAPRAVVDSSSCLVERFQLGYESTLPFSSNKITTQGKGEMETFFLQRSLKRSIWEIVKRPRGNE